MRDHLKQMAALLTAAGMLTLAGCAPSGERQAQQGAEGGAESRVAADAAARTFVPPGQLDEYYLFYSGGHSGQVYLAGVPSMRHIATIPVFTPYPATGYGFDEETKQMLGGYTWGDVHHPALSQTNSNYDGRWLFVNDNGNNRVARINLSDMKTHQIIKIPNVMGNHGSSFVTGNTEYILSAARFSVPVPNTYAPVSEYAQKYKGIVSGVKVDNTTGEMSTGFQVLMPPFNYDLGSPGKGPSEGWAFWTCYNSERATGRLEVTASKNPRDYVVALDWKAAAAAVAAGKADRVNGVPMLDPKKVPNIVYLLPTPTSPHGVDVTPDGKYMAASGKLAPVTTIFEFAKMQQAIANKDFTGNEDGVPVIKFESVKTAEVPVGMGPLHTEYDDQGFGYTSLFLESAITKWKIGTWEVVDKIPVSYNVGHLSVAGGNTANPYGKYMVSLNKISKGRQINTGPSKPESSQLIDITGNKMTMLYEAFTEPEPHAAQFLKADAIKVLEVYPKADNKNPNSIWLPGDAKVTRSGKNVDVKLYMVRTFFAPSNIEVQQGDTVTVHLTNAEQTRDEIHGWGLNEYDINVVVDPGETKTVKFVASKPGVYAYYCTNFCSALHQEMQGYLTVKPL